MGRGQRLVVVLLELAVDHVLGLILVVELHRQHTKGIGDQVDREMIAEDLGVALEDLAFLGSFDMVVERENALVAVEPRQLVHQVERVAIVLGLPFGAPEDLEHRLARAPDQPEGIGDDERAERRAADHHPFERQGVGQHRHLAARQDEAAEDQAKDNAETNDDRHLFIPCA